MRQLRPYPHHVAKQVDWPTEKQYYHNDEFKTSQCWRALAREHQMRCTTLRGRGTMWPTLPERLGQMSTHHIPSHRKYQYSAFGICGGEVLRNGGNPFPPNSLAGKQREHPGSSTNLDSSRCEAVSNHKFPEKGATNIGNATEHQHCNVRWAQNWVTQQHPQYNKHPPSAMCVQALHSMRL